MQQTDTEDGAAVLAVMLYLATLACELPAVAVRYYITYGFFWFAHAAGTEHLPTKPVVLVVAFGPLVWSALAFTPLGGSGWWWQQIAGGRTPSERERLAYEDAIADLDDPDLRPDKLELPRHVFVLDEPEPGAAVSGDTLMLTRAMTESPYLPAVIAHELGHLNTLDAPITDALNRLILRQPRPRQRYGPLSFSTWVLWRLATGGTSLPLMTPVWGSWWRRREHAADAYAARLGRADELAEFLETHALLYDRPVPLVWLTEHTHPPTEHRIERLQQHAEATA